jgi:hypothetical protein
MCTMSSPGRQSARMDDSARDGEGSVFRVKPNHESVGRASGPVAGNRAWSLRPREVACEAKPRRAPRSGPRRGSSKRRRRCPMVARRSRSPGIEHRALGSMSASSGAWPEGPRSALAAFGRERSPAKRSHGAPREAGHAVDRRSGRRGSNSRHSAWKADALPLSYARRGPEIYRPRPRRAVRGRLVARA